MADKHEPRIYGAPDGNDRDTPPAEGLRGEQTTLTPDDETRPELRREVTLSTGVVLEVAEESGVGWAESTGRAGLVESEPHLDPAEDRGAQGAPADPKVMPDQHPERRAFAEVPGGGKLLVALAALVGIGVAAWLGRDRIRPSA